MKTSPTGWGAQYTDSDGKELILPVEKWSLLGRALVADEKTGQLVPATKRRGFVELVPLHRVVAVVPAAPGWKISAHAFGGSPAYSTPIAAWVMDGEGQFWPVIAHGGESKDNPDPRGEITLTATWSTRNRIIPPTQESQQPE